MSNPAQIILYGNSILIAGIELALRQRGNWPVIRLHPCAPDELDGLQEGVLVYDLGDSSGLITPAFLITHPNLQVIGLDGTRGQARIWHNKWCTIIPMDDLDDLLTALQTGENE